MKKQKTEDRKKITSHQTPVTSKDEQLHKEDIDADTKTALYFEEEKRKVEEAGDIAVGEIKRKKEIENKYLDGMPYNLEMLVGKYEVLATQTAKGLIEMGKILLAVKEYEGHGKWTKVVEERFHMSRSTAWRFMAIARKFAKSFTVNDLLIKGALHHDGAGKLYALLNIPDEELAEFDDTGLFRGATVEDINKMSVKDFRKLIAEKEDWKARAKQFELELQSIHDNRKQHKENIAIKENLIDKLNLEIQSLKSPKPYTDDEQKYRDMITELGVMFESILVRIKTQIPYDNPKKDEVPQKSLRDLFFFLIFMQKEAQDERLKLAQFYEGCEDVTWDSMPGELPPDEIIQKNVPHLKKFDEMIEKHRAKKE